MPRKPLVIYIAETDHGDMSYSSLLRKMIEDCDSKGLSTKVFSEFESQTYKVNGKANSSRDDAIDGVPVDIDTQLAVLRNAPSKETHISNTEFLDRHFIPMGGVRKRWRELVPQNWERLPEEIKTGTPENLLNHFEELGAIDDPAILKMMKDDVIKGELPTEDGINDAATNAKSYYRYWRGCLNYKFIHEGMAQDVKKGLAGAVPEVMIMIAGRAHIQGLNQQFDLHLPEFADSQKVVIRNSKEVVIDEKIGALIEFKFDTEKREAHIPDSLNEMMDERSLSKKITSMKTKLESFAILADNGFRKVGEVHKDSSGVISEGLSSVYAESPMTEQTVSGIGSVGKQHTVATLLKLWDNELAAPESEKKWFVDGDDVGMDVKLKKFMPLLKEKYLDCLEFFHQIETYDYFDRITLADLLNHTHGLGARDNGKMSELILAGDGSPLPLSDIVKSSRKRTEKDVGISDSDKIWDQHGEMCYGNLGYDLAGMIIETITEKDFDRAVKETLLEPYALNSTTTQSDHQSLYDSKTLHGQQVDVATGFAQQGDHGEINFNKLSNTRAAGGMKSTIADLERFAHLFMGGEMFESEQVKDAIAQRGGRPYYFAIEQNEDGTLGHKGDDTVFRSNLKFNPNTKEVEAELQVLENLTHHVSRKVFEKLYGSERVKELDSSIVDSGFFPIFHQNGRPKPGGEKFNQLAQGLLETNPALDQLVSDYTKIREIVTSHSTEALKENMSKIVDSITEDLSPKKESFVEKLGLQKRSTEQEKSFVERVRSDATKGKSQGGFNEL